MPELPVDESEDTRPEREVEEAIGEALRTLRIRLGLTLQGVADRAGISIGMVSKIENAQTSPSLRTIAQLARALGVPIPTLFGNLARIDASVVVRNAEMPTRAEPRRGYSYAPLASISRAEPFRGYIVTIEESGAPYVEFEHAGTELLYVLSGRLTYRCGDEAFELAPGDSLALPGTVAHGPEAFSDFPVRVLLVSSREHAFGM